MTGKDLVSAFKPVQDELTRLGIDFYVGGSVASSHYGAARSTLDVDVVTDLDETSASKLIAAVGDQYYGSEVAARDAVQRQSCFNLIHLETSFKIDLFIRKDRPYDQKAMARKIQGKIGDGTLETNIASVEDVILSKLEWYRIGNEVSERQWDDLTRVCDLNEQNLDVNYLESFAVELDVTDLLARLMNQR